jgi:hypothetical protein
MFGQKKKKVENAYTLVIDWDKVKTVEDMTSILRLIHPFSFIVLNEEAAEKGRILHLTKKVIK